MDIGITVSTSLFSHLYSSISCPPPGNSGSQTYHRCILSCVVGRTRKLYAHGVDGSGLESCMQIPLPRGASELPFFWTCFVRDHGRVICHLPEYLAVSWFLFIRIKSKEVTPDILPVIVGCMRLDLYKTRESNSIEWANLGN